jgi:hypothetical protein
MQDPQVARLINIHQSSVNIILKMGFLEEAWDLFVELTALPIRITEAILPFGADLLEGI